MSDLNLDDFLESRFTYRHTDGRLYVPVKELRQWMAGKVLVPVDVLYHRWASKNIAVPKDVSGAKATEMFWRGVYEYQNLLAAAVKGSK